MKAWTAINRVPLCCWLILVLPFLISWFAKKPRARHLNWYIVEQLPVVPPECYETIRFGPKTAGRLFAMRCWN